MPKVTVQFIDLTVTIEDNKTPYNVLLNTASKEISHLMDNPNVKQTMNKIFAKHGIDDDEEAQIPMKNTDKGMFA